jgi:integral membrane protein (TIGR01906 family)
MNSPATPKKASRLTQVLSWLVTLLVPIALTLTAVRIMLSPAYIQIEYRMPGFPDDPYGFNQEERLKNADIARVYLLNSAGINFLGDLKLSSGESLYNERELEHMLDVKKVVQAAIWVWYASLILLAGFGAWAWFGGWRREYRRGLGRGGWLTVILLGTLVVLVILSFGFIFVAFHNVFFAAGTWTFDFTDTLIRLFPERFWRDIFLAVGGLTILGGFLLGWFFGRKKD